MKFGEVPVTEAEVSIVAQMTQILRRGEKAETA